MGGTRPHGWFCPHHFLKHI